MRRSSPSCEIQTIATGTAMGIILVLAGLFCGYLLASNILEGDKNPKKPVRILPVEELQSLTYKGQKPLAEVSPPLLKKEKIGHNQ